MNHLTLSESQQEAFKYITNNLPKHKVILLEGSAGTGKTTLTKNICNYYNETKQVMVCAIAPTHKAKKIIKNILNKNTILPVSALTVASALGKIKEHSYVGAQTYSKGNLKKLSIHNLFIIDEVSMIRDEDLRLIVDFVITHNRQLIIIGDSNQIPCPSAKFIVSNIIEKSDSYVFNDPSIHKITLTQIVRQSSDSPIIRLATFVRNNLTTDLTFDRIMTTTSFDNIISYDEMYTVFANHFMPTVVNSCRIISYTNSSVKTHNAEVRRVLDYNDEYVNGELLTGYSNIGFPELIIENGEDYFIKSVVKTDNYSIGLFTKLCGNKISLRVADTNVSHNNLFFININHHANNLFMSRLIELGEKINSCNSSKIDYRNYMELKNKVIFTDDIYKYEDTIYTETSFKEIHSLLFTNINEVIENSLPRTCVLATKIETTYPEIIATRIKDRYKVFGDSESFADKFKVIEKDIYYGYAITAHKSQASTYKSVIVDEMDFQKISNRWNYKFNKLESRVKEKNQIRYVAYTRASEDLYVVHD